MTFSVVGLPHKTRTQIVDGIALGGGASRKMDLVADTYSFNPDYVASELIEIIRACVLNPKGSLFLPELVDPRPATKGRAQGFKANCHHVMVHLARDMAEIRRNDRIIYYGEFREGQGAEGPHSWIQKDGWAGNLAQIPGLDAPINFLPDDVQKKFVKPHEETPFTPRDYLEFMERIGMVKQPER